MFIVNTRYISRERRPRATLWPPATRSRLGKLDARGAEGCIARRRRRFPARARLAFGAALWEAVERLLEERGTKRDELPVVLDEPRVVLHKVGRRPVGARVGLMRVGHGTLHPAKEAVEHAGRLVEARGQPDEAVLAQQVPHRAAQVRRADAPIESEGVAHQRAPSVDGL